MMNILPDVNQAKEFVDKAANTTNTFIGAAVTTILAAMNSGVRTTSISVSGQSTNDIRFLLGDLNRKGYKAQIGTGNTIQVAW